MHNSSLCSIPISSECQVCGQKGDGRRHYGAVVCRACAAFFRRSGTFQGGKKCKKNEKCDFIQNGYFNCKYCRLKKCIAVGMTSENFQFERDTYHKIETEITLNNKIPPTLDTFCGTSNLIIFRAPQFSPSCSSFSKNTQKNYIDLHFLVKRTENILKQGPAAPIQCRTRLEKLAIGLHPLLQTRNMIGAEAKIYGKEELLGQLEHDILTVTKWITHFDEYQKLSLELQLRILQGIWHVWVKLAKLYYTAKSVRKQFDKFEIRKMEKDHCFYSFDQNRIDMSWLSKYTIEELKFFIDIKNEYRLDDLTRAMLDLDPSDVELSFMLCQLCFHYIGKRYQGEVLEVTEKFQEVLANDLHEHYVEQIRQPNYSKRLSQMMKINNQIQTEIYKNKSKTDLALVFDIFCVDVSHPEMFVEV